MIMGCFNVEQFLQLVGLRWCETNEGVDAGDVIELGTNQLTAERVDERNRLRSQLVGLMSWE